MEFMLNPINLPNRKLEALYVFPAQTSAIDAAALREHLICFVSVMPSLSSTSHSIKSMNSIRGYDVCPSSITHEYLVG